MNKYDRKLSEIVSGDDDLVIYELTCEKVKSNVSNIADLFLDGILSLKDAIKGLRNRTAYYLVINKDDQVNLVEINQELHVSTTDITGALKTTKSANQFDYNDNRYTIIRKK